MMCGHKRKAKAHGKIMDIMVNLKKRGRYTAREVVQGMAEEAKGSEALPRPVAIK